MVQHASIDHSGVSGVPAHNHTSGAGDGGDLDSPEIDGYAIFNEESAPASAASGTVRLYAKSDGLLYSKDDAGTETLVSSGSGSGIAGDCYVYAHVPASFYTVDSGTWTTVQYTDVPSAAGFPFMGSALQSNGAQNEAISWQFFLAAGTWRADFFVRKSTNTGIITLNLDASGQGTADTYAAAAAQAVVSITGWTIATGGQKTIQVKAETKNASSSNYYLEIAAFRLLRTA